MVGALVLSQQTEPLLQFAVCGIKTDGLSQKAAIILSKQNPGHLGPGSLVVGRGVVLVILNSTDSSFGYNI